MQHGYGAPEIQQFLVDGCSLFSISHEINNNSQAKHLEQQQQQQEQQRFQQSLHPTQQFFHQHHHHHHHHHHRFQALQQQQQQHQHNSPARVVPLLGSFKPSVTESVNREPLTDHDDALGEDSIRGPVWKFADLAYSNKGTKRCKDKLEESGRNKFFKKGEENDEQNEEDGDKNNNNNNTSYRLFGELEAIYSGSSNKVSTASIVDMQTGSSSVLTGDNPPPTATVKSGMPETGNPQIDLGSETSAEAEASLRKIQKKNRKRKRKHLKSVAVFFESLVTQLMDYQEGLHKKFLEIMERRDQERMNREEEWRRQETSRLNRETAIRAQEQALASSREAAIVSFLEKITGEKINLPRREAFVAQEETHTEEEKQQEKQIETRNNNNNNSARRWPRTEVQALVRVRYGLEQRFQEPGLKGPLWEEVSSTMASMGYHRSAKRCKEKWENINKYFRKTKGNAKKRSQHSKTCPYFHQLDLLYGKGLNSSSSSSSKSDPKDPAAAMAKKIAVNDNSELLGAIMPADHGTWQTPSLESVQDQFKLHEMGSLRLDFSSNDDKNKEIISSKAGKGLLEQERQNDEEEEYDDEEDEEEDEDYDGDDVDGYDQEEEDEEEEERDGGHEREKQEKKQFGIFFDLVHKLTADSTTVGGGNSRDFAVSHSDPAPPYSAG